MTKTTPKTPLALAADLHVHSTHSDGALSPGEVVRAAASVGLGSVSITDHDTLSAIAVARPEAKRLGLDLIPGVELTAELDGREIHVLGHYVRDDDPALAEATGTLRVARKARIEAMVGRLSDLGLSVSLEAIRGAYPRATVGRKHLADWLVRSGQVADHRAAFGLYLGEGGPAEVPKPRLRSDRAIALIRGAGGVAGLAHPPYNLQRATLVRLVDQGLGSIEVGGPGINRANGLRWRAWGLELGLAPIAGTDFHAADRPGRWIGSIVTPGPDLDRLRRNRPPTPPGGGPSPTGPADAGTPGLVSARPPGV